LPEDALLRVLAQQVVLGAGSWRCRLLLIGKTSSLIVEGHLLLLAGSSVLLSLAHFHSDVGVLLRCVVGVNLDRSWARYQISLLAYASAV
jgi:hypothetical protein